MTNAAEGKADRPHDEEWLMAREEESEVKVWRNTDK